MLALLLRFFRFSKEEIYRMDQSSAPAGCFVFLVAATAACSVDLSRAQVSDELAEVTHSQFVLCNAHNCCNIHSARIYQS